MLTPRNFFFASFLTCFSLLAVAVSPAEALTLDEAKTNLLVGEQVDGYLGVTSKSASAEVKKLVDEINDKRREMYQQIAKKNGTDVKAVEKLAAKKAIEITAPGNMIQLPNGQWAKR